MAFLLKTLLLAMFSLSLSGCFYLQAAQGQLSLLAHRQPISKVLNDTRTSDTVRTRLSEAQAARRFAVTDLGLPDNRSYTSYVDIHRPAVVWNVFAAPELSVNPIQWCFPIAGCVVYRGYFSQAAAERFALKLRTQGLDAAVSGAPAYSTLGHFNDPVLSSMLGWSNAQLAATLFHELAHQVAYAPGQSSFNEAFATVVENAGLHRWLISQHREAEWRIWQQQEQRASDVADLLRVARRDLQAMYAGTLSSDAKRDRKQQRLGQLKFEYQLLKERWQQRGLASNGYDSWFSRRLSNAQFVAMSTYQDCVPMFEQLLHSVDDDLPRFYASVQRLITDRKAATWCRARVPSDINASASSDINGREAKP